MLTRKKKEEKARNIDHGENPPVCHGAASTDQDTKKQSLAYEKRDFRGGRGGEKFLNCAT